MSLFFLRGARPCRVQQFSGTVPYRSYDNLFFTKSISICQLPLSKGLLVSSLKGYAIFRFYKTLINKLMDIFPFQMVVLFAYVI